MTRKSNSLEAHLKIVFTSRKMYDWIMLKERKHQHLLVLLLPEITINESIFH